MSTFSIMGPHNTDLPDPFDIFPIDDTAVCFIKNVVTTPNVEVGEYTYYEDDENPTEFDRKNVLYNRPEFGDKLIIGKFCAIGANTKFIMGAANHSVSTVSTYPRAAADFRTALNDRRFVYAIEAPVNIYKQPDNLPDDGINCPSLAPD